MDERNETQSSKLSWTRHSKHTYQITGLELLADGVITNLTTKNFNREAHQHNHAQSANSASEDQKWPDNLACTAESDVKPRHRSVGTCIVGLLPPRYAPLAQISVTRSTTQPPMDIHTSSGGTQSLNPSASSNASSLSHASRLTPDTRAHLTQAGNQPHAHKSPQPPCHRRPSSLPHRAQSRETKRP